MTATNHALTGAFIGLALGNPWVALPVALASHFVCDAIPHFGHARNDMHWLRSKFFKRLLLTDIALCFVIAGTIVVRHPANWVLAVICAFVATSPDFYWIGKFKAALGHKQLSSPKGFAYFAGVIQWFQKPIGSIVEVAWLLGMIVLLLPFLR
jgi:hypothetical protein